MPIYGLPDVPYSDHGSDFTSARLERVCLDTRVTLIHSRIGVPQGRGKIERFYGTVTTELLPHLPGHIPHGTGGHPITVPTLTLEQLDGIFEQFIVTDYNQRPHSQTGDPPTTRWAASGFIPRSPYLLLFRPSKADSAASRCASAWSATFCIAGELLNWTMV